MFLWCPHWCQRPTAAVWRSVSMDDPWTWTRPSTNTMTSAHTPAPCWTLSSDQGISLPKLIHTQFIQAMGINSNIFIKAFCPVKKCFRLECRKKKKEKLDQVLWCSLEPLPKITLSFYCDDIAAWRYLQEISQYSQCSDYVR